MLDGALGFDLQAMSPPLVHGVARLAGILYAGGSNDDLLNLIGPEPADTAERAGWLMDLSWIYALNFAPEQSDQLQRQALRTNQVFRVRGSANGPRLLALTAPGGLMVNTPLDFIAEPAGLALDLAIIRPGGGLPPLLPDHDAAIVAASDSEPEVLTAIARVYGAWPRPILNDPARILPISRTWLPTALAGLPGLFTAPARIVSRGELAATLLPTLLPGTAFPFLLRPLGSHAGQGLVAIDAPGDVERFLGMTPGDDFTLTQFIDYRGANGWYGKHRIAFVDGAPFLCHMASSEHWMVHYLNAGMDKSPAKRAAEAKAMAEFDAFARRHRAGLDALVRAMGLDYFSIDCAELPDGRILVFEADTAAIIHSMDQPELYPYKGPAMQRCYDAFGAMVRNRAKNMSGPARMEAI